MSNPRMRDRIARLAAQMMYERQETEYFNAKRKAARRLGFGRWIPAGDLPANREIRDYIGIFASAYEGAARIENLRAMRLAALKMMRRLGAFRPALIGSVFTGHVRKGSDVDIHVFSDSIAAVADTLEDAGLNIDVERKRVVKHGEVHTYVHVRLHDRFPFEMTVYPAEKATYGFKSSITGKTIERATLRQLEQFLREEYRDIDIEAEIEGIEAYADRFDTYRMLLEPLGSVKQDPQFHPEGDALYHSLQVFELAREDRPWDEEFLIAALLHDVGKAIDPREHVAAGLEALEGLISERTAFLIAQHMDMQALHDGDLGRRARKRLEQSECFEDLELLRELDDAGRRAGAIVCEIDEALECLRALEKENNRA